LSLRHDCGSQYISDDFQDELSFLGIEASPAFVRSPQCNGCAERFIRTLKENLLWIHTFESIDDLCQALQGFKRQYNESWIIEKHSYKTPKRVREKCLSTIKTAAYI
jgi:transposase InsO family protein